MPAKPKAIEEYESRITGEYIADQLLQYKKAARHSEHKQQLEKNDKLYKSDLSDFYPQGERAPDHIRVENKYKNALHDIVRLAAESKPTTVFMQQGDSRKAAREARIRANIADTYWEVNRGPRQERSFLMDMAGAGYCAAAVYFNDDSDYPQFMRLDPRMCYPDIRNGALVSMVYAETVKVDVAKRQWPQFAGEFAKFPKGDKNVTLAIYYDEHEVVTAVTQERGSKGFVVDRWGHELGCVPVAFEMLDTADREFHGLFDHVGGPLAFRDRMMGYLDDYMEDMVHSPFEAKNVLNAEDPPGPLTIYEHDPGAEESFIRRVAPAAPAGTVFGLLQYAGEQEATEALQPPARIGQVRQSIASGDFVNSTQGALSSAVRELQGNMGNFRYQIGYVCMKLDRKELDFEKPLIRSIGGKKTYTPSEDLGSTESEYFHRIVYGASAGLDRQYADVRVIQHVGAGLISKKMGREQLEYVDDPFQAQEEIYQEQMADVMFQRFAADPNTPISAIAESLVQMGKGKDLIEVMEAQAEQMLQREQEARQAMLEAAGGGAPAGGAPSEEPGAQAEALEAGATGEEDVGAEVAPLRPFQPPILQQQIVQSRRQ